MSLNPLSMNWAESIMQKLIYFLIIATLFVMDFCVVNIFDNADTKGRILNLTLQFLLIYIVTIIFSKFLVTFGRRVR